MGNEAFYLADTEPMGVVAEVIRNDMGDSLGIMVYDDITRQVHKFRAKQLVVRPDGNVTVLPSWFRKSRDILKNIGPMEEAVPTIRKARRKGIRLSDEDAAKATSSAPPEVQRFIDEAVILRSQLIGKLHGLFEKQAATEAQLREATSPGLFDRTPEADRVLIIATHKRSLRLNNQTIGAMRDFLVQMDTSHLFPKDPRYRSLFKLEEFQAVQEAVPAVPEEGMEEFETFEDAGEEVAEFDPVDEFETFEDVAEVAEFDSVDEFAAVPDAAAPPPPVGGLPPPPPPAAAAMAAAPIYDHVEALPDADDMTVHQPSLMTVGAPGWTPPQPEDPFAAAPPPQMSAAGMPPPQMSAAGLPPPPPGAVQPPPPVPMPQMDALEASAQRKIEGEPAAPEPVAKKAGLLGRLRRGKEKKDRPPTGAVVAGAAAGGAIAASASRDTEEFAPVEEFAPLQAAAPAQAQPPMPPPPTIPPPPAYTPHADTFQSVDEFETFEETPPTEEFAPLQAAAPPAPPPQAPPPLAPQPAPMPAPAPAPAPAPVPPPAPAPAPARAPVAAPAPVEVFETFEEEEVIEEFSEEVDEGRPLDAEKDIDAILAMALGKSVPPKGTKPTAKPGVREEIGSPMQSLLSKTKYRRP